MQNQPSEFTFLIPTDLKNAFWEAAAAEEKTAESVILDLMQDYVRKSSNWDLTEALVAAGFKGQREQLEDILKAGVPLYYQDSKGNLVQENPDGTIEVVQGQ